MLERFRSARVAVGRAAPETIDGMNGMFEFVIVIRDRGAVAGGYQCTASSTVQLDRGDFEATYMPTGARKSWAPEEGDMRSKVRAEILLSQTASCRASHDVLAESDVYQTTS